MNKTSLFIKLAAVVMLIALIVLVTNSYYENKRMAEEMEEECCDGRCGEEIDDATGQYIFDLN